MKNAKITTAAFVATAYTRDARDIVQKWYATQIDIKHYSQHGSFCLKMLQAMKSKISWKSLIFLV